MLHVDCHVNGQLAIPVTLNTSNVIFLHTIHWKALQGSIHKLERLQGARTSLATRHGCPSNAEEELRWTRTASED